MPPPAEAEPGDMSSVLGGLVGGLAGAILATGIWYGVVAATQWQVGLVAVAVGWIVGQGVAFGAQRRGSVALIPISVVLTLVALAVSEYLIIAHFVGQEFAAAGVPFDVLQPVGVMVEVIVESIKVEPITLAFWAIALVQAFVIPARLLGRRTA